MTIRKIAFAVATIAALSPAISNAATERSSVKACASAFAASIAEPGSNAPAYKVDYRGMFEGSLSDYYTTAYSFTLEARDPKTGATIARATCSTDYRGGVTSISAMPLNSKSATLAQF